MRKARRAKGWLFNNAPWVFGWVIQTGLVVPLAALYGDSQLIMLPEFATAALVYRRLPEPTPFDTGMRAAPLPLVGGAREVPLGVWYFVVQIAAAFVLRVLRL